MNDKHQGRWTPAWPARSDALLRLLLITLALLPPWWTVYALLVGDWQLNFGEGGGEPTRHLVEGLII